MKFKNNKDKDFVLSGIFKDPTRSVKVPASGEVSFPKNRLADHVEDKLRVISEIISLEEDSAPEIQDNEFESKTISNKVVHTEVTVKPWVAFTKEGIKSEGDTPNPSSTATLFDSNGQGIEDVVSSQLSKSYLDKTIKV